MPGVDKWSRGTACHGPRSLRGTGSWPRAGIHRIRKDAEGRSIGRGYHRKSDRASVLALRNNAIVTRDSGSGDRATALP